MTPDARGFRTVLLADTRVRSLLPLTFRAAVLTDASLRMAETTDATQRLLADLLSAAGPDRDEVQRLIGQYQAGSLTLAQLVAQAQQVMADRANDELDDLPDGKRARHTVLRAAAGLGVLGALAVLGKGSPRSVGSAAASLSVSAGAAEFPGVTVGRSTAVTDLNDRLAAIRATQQAGSISDAQAAAQTQSCIGGFTWHRYQSTRNDAAQQAGKATASYVLDDSVKQHCQTCLDREAGNPWPIDQMPGLPTEDTDCGPGDQCDVEYD